MGWETRECDFDAEARRSGDRRRRATRKKERARRNVAFGSGFEGTDEPVVEWGGKAESVILTRRRGDAEIGAEKQRERKNERGDSGGTSPSVRHSRVTGEKTQNRE